ncbi:MAG: hypothetical protein ACRDKT_02305 [Actinomycetota bacterium]
MTLRISRVVALRAAIGVVLALIPISALAGAASPVELKPGRAAFWNGPVVGSSSGSSCGEAKCWEYRFDVAAGGERLRIGIDHPELQDVYELEVFAPGNDRVASFGPPADIYSAEELLQPLPGVWRIVVRAESVTDSAFRLRAKLEKREPFVGTGKEPVLPNLQILPPHDASFMTPITNGGTGGASMGVDLGAGCHAEEHGEDGAVRCLRFSYGVRNTGLGPMDLILGSGNQLERELIQRVHRVDGSTFDRVAGVARWHKTHLHHHHHNAIGLRLYRVTDRRTGKLEPASAKRMKGFAHRNELLRDWEHFYPTPTMQGFGLLPGWSDIYEWDRPGNYIDFGLNADGYYVVRMWADPVKGVLESNERDNLGYTYLKVTGTQVELLEAGRGSDPWDECKIEVGFGGHPDPPRERRPAHCPPDTT